MDNSLRSSERSSSDLPVDSNHSWTSSQSSPTSSTTMLASNVSTETLVAPEPIFLANKPISSFEDVESLSSSAELSQKYQSLSEPRADGGREAWLFLLGSFWIESLIYGFPFSFGVFEEYYTTHVPFSSASASVPTIGTTAGGLMYLLAPIWALVLSRWPITQRILPTLGITIVCASLVASAFATSVGQLIATQGVVYAIGGSMTYCSMIRALDTWFIQRKGMAFGIVLAGNGFSGVTISYLVTAGFSSLGYRNTVIVWAVIDAVILGAFVYWQKPRVSSAAKQLPSFSFLRSPRFFVPLICTIIQGLGFFLPSIYLPKITSKLFPELSSAYQDATLTALNGAAVAGCLFIGFLGDYMSANALFGITAAGAAVSVFWFFGFAIQPVILIVFAVTYGFFAGSWSVNWTGAIVDLQKAMGDGSIDAGFVYGLFLAARGLGNIVSGPLSSALLGLTPLHGAAAVYGSQYGFLVIVTGSTSVVGGLCFLSIYFGK